MFKTAVYKNVMGKTNRARGHENIFCTVHKIFFVIVYSARFLKLHLPLSVSPTAFKIHVHATLSTWSCKCKRMSIQISNGVYLLIHHAGCHSTAFSYQQHIAHGVYK